MERWRRPLPAPVRPSSLNGDGSLRGSKGNTVQARKAEAVAAPATVSGETTPLMITGKPGRSASVVNPRARRPAIAREADLGRGEPMVCILGAHPRDRAVFPDSMRGCHAWNRLNCPE